MRVLQIFAVSIAFFVLSVAVLPQTETLSNEKIITLSQSGISDSLIIRKINTENNDFNLTTDGLVALKKAGVSDVILSAMFDAGSKNQFNKTPESETKLPSATDAPQQLMDENRVQADIQTVSYDQNPSARIVLNKSEALLNAKTIAIEKSSLHPSRQALEKELMKRADWQALDLNIVRLKDDADLYIEIGYVSLSWITHRYVYRVYDRKSGTVITAGETTSWGSLAENLARGIAKRLTDEFAEARKTK